DARRMEDLETKSRKGTLKTDELHELGVLWRRRTWERRINGDSGKLGAGALWDASPIGGKPGLRKTHPATTRHPPPGEAVLLQKINQGPDPVTWNRYHELVARRRAEALEAGEHAELIALSNQIEEANAVRLEHLVKLAQLRRTTLRGVMEQLGLGRAPY